MRLLIALLLASFLLCLCQACSRHGEASERQKQAVQAALRRYEDHLREMPAQERGKLPIWLRDLRSTRVITVERVGPAFKALVQLTHGEGQTARWLLIQKRNGQLEVSGVM